MAEVVCFHHLLAGHFADAENVSDVLNVLRDKFVPCKDRSSLLTYASAGDGSPHFDLVTLTAQKGIMRRSKTGDIW